MVLVLAAASAVALFTFADPRISESSGLATATTPGVVFTHNDSGDEPRFFAVDEQGQTLATYTLPIPQARDWEDMARGPDERGRSSLWLGDIGDNSATRERGILVHRVREPVPGGRERVTTEPPSSFRLLYPDGPGDAEALLVHPRTGRLYVVSKPLAGPAKVYAAPPRLDAGGPNALALVAEVDLEATGTSGGPGIGGLAQLLVTAGDVSPDGTRVALRSYTDLYEWIIEGDDVAAAFNGPPRITALPETRQGEGLAYTADGTALLLSTEGQGAPVHRVPSAAGRPATSGSDPVVETGDEPPPVDRVAGQRRWPLVAGGGLAVAVLLVVRGAVRRRRYTRR